MRSLLITRPDDWHIHFRDGTALQDTVTASAQYFHRALAMPNLSPPLIKLADLVAYHQRLKNVLSQNSSFEPFVTFYINENTSADDLIAAKNFPFILGAKLYPAGATTNSAQGVKAIENLYPLLEIMEREDLVLQIHGETTSGDIFEREQVFILDHLATLIQKFPKLRVVLEHISTQSAVEFVHSGPANLAATITPHHLLFNRNHLLSGGIRPHFYCLPILKSEADQFALRQAAASGSPKFFAGTDSAPHPQHNKENACGCAGIYCAPIAVAMYTQVFSDLGKLDLLEGFLSHFGAEFYQQPITDKKIQLIEKSQVIPDFFIVGKQKVIPAGAGQTLDWSVDEE